MRALDNLSISKKIFGLLGLMVLITVSVATILVWILNDTDDRYSDLVKKDLRVVVEVMRVRGDLTNYARQMNNVLLVQKPPQGLDALETSLADIMGGGERSLKTVRDLGQGQAAVLANEIAATLPRIKRTSSETIAIKRSGDPEQDSKARALWGGPEGRTLVLKLYADIAKLADDEIKRVGSVTDGFAARTDNTTLLSIVMITLGLIGSSLLAYAVATWGISRPLAGLGGTMRRLADGDLSAEIAGAVRRDEVGTMAGAVQVFKDNAVRARVLEVEAQQARETAERERARNEAERAAIAKQQAEVVKGLATGLARLSQGDLTGRLSSFPEDYKQLEGDFNAAIGKLQETITVIAGNSEGIHSGSGEISQAADDLSKRTEQQAASLEETAAALDQITATVRKTAEGAKHASEVVAGARGDAERSGQVVQDAVVAMGAIEKSAQEISQIIGVIDEIAFQTNLLALNAGVEAARAGDAGRGFAVVASEVRALAQRSAEAAKEIKGLISTSSSQVASGVALVGETGKALSRIVSQVNEITGIVAEISASAQEQAVGLQQVNTAVNQMDQMTQQNAAMVEESTAASHSLAKEAQTLTNLIGRFNVGEPAAAGRTSRSRVTAPPPARSAQATSHARTRARGNTALAARSDMQADESWEEF